MRDILAAIGCVLILGGAYWANPPHAVMLLGLILIAIAVAWARGVRK